MQRRQFLGAAALILASPKIARGGFAGFQNAALKSFSTNFSDAPENPISEGDAWFHTPNPWAFIKTLTSPNRAVGTQTGSPSGTFNDSYALRAGFRPNVLAQATVYKDPTIDTGSGSHEVELLVRMSDNSTQARGYEFNWSSIGAYAEIVKWNGALGNFTSLANFGAHTPLVTGDMVGARVNGPLLTALVKRVGDSDWTQMSQITDNTFTDGQPGIGMWLQDSSQFANQSKFALSDYFVTEI